MDNLNNKNQSLIDDEDALREAASCLQDYLKVHSKSTRHFVILQFLADNTLKHLDEGKTCHFNNVAIKDAVVRNTETDPSAWISPLWKTLVTATLPGLEEGLITFAQSKGHNHYPWVNKREGGGAGNQTLYFLEARKVNVVDKNALLLNSKVKNDVTYIPAVNVLPSWWAKWLFNQNNSANGWRKMIYVFYPMIPIIFSLLFFLAVWLVNINKNTPISAQDIASFTLILAMFFYCRHILRTWLHLMEDQIIMAPDNLLSMAERDVWLVLVSTYDERTKKKTKALRLVKYASQCPICKAEILLDKGEPDFPRRIVGRCQESPREHVYSFDRALKAGYKLR
jgi:hypothetical protein